MLLIAVGTARADVVGDAGKKIATYESDERELASGIQKPSRDPRKEDAMARRLIDAQVAFGTGNYENAALLLYDYIAQPSRGADYDTAIYYLAESLFQKNDRVASRTYFAQLVKEVGPRSKYYQQSLERLIELSLALGEDEGVMGYLAELDRVPADKRQASVPYVRGKYAYSVGDFDEALSWLAQVPADSEYGFQAQYFLGVAHVAKKDLGKATQAMSALLERDSRNDDEARVKELAQLALGRLYYERDQPTKAIDSYLLIDRKSDLFPDALYEVAWVYVKSQQFDKALRALELLALADPTSQKLPTVKILEGNLRIRKAQGIHDKSTQGLDIGAASSTEEYEKAGGIFTATHDTYVVPHDELGKIIAANEDPQLFMAQITGRSSETFQTNATMPEIAAAWIRDEPDVGRVMTIETDLGDIQAEISDAERTIERLDAALTTPNRVNIFPSLATKRSRSTEMAEDLLALRIKLADEERKLAGKAGGGLAELDRLVAARQALVKQLSALPDADVAYGQRIERARGAFDTLDQQASEIQVAIDTTAATVVAIDKFLKESAEPAEPTAKAAWATQRLEAQKVITELTLEIDAMHLELSQIRREVVLGRDEAGTGDEAALRGRSLRVQLRGALAAEHVAAERLTAGTPKGAQVADLIRRGDRVLAQLDGVDRSIDEVVEVALEEVKDSLTRERAELASYRREFLLYEAESRALGGTVLGEAFRSVKSKFYEVLVRTDVGVVDVSWSQKEESDDDLTRYTLDKSRELKQLRDEFADLVNEAREEKAAEEEKARKEGGAGATPGATTPPTTAPTTAPGGTTPGTPTAPTTAPGGTTPTPTTTTTTTTPAGGGTTGTTTGGGLP
jgi:tetratricopeptide (TPR) repeat protein